MNRELYIPFRKFTLKECNKIISAACNPKGHTYMEPKKVEIAELHQSWIDACLNESTKELTKWEKDFLYSINDQIANTGSISEKQAAILERIYTEKV